MSDGVFQIDPNPEDIDDRRADRIAEHQRTEAMRAGWTGDNWLYCGSCTVRGACPNATCTHHRMAGIRHVVAAPRPIRAGAAGTTEGALRQLAEGIHATGGTPSSLPIGASFSIVGSWRVYFNQHAAAPLVWNVSPADGSWEIAVASLTIHAPAICTYEPKGRGVQPVAWLAVDGQLTVCVTGHASIGMSGAITSRRSDT